MSVYLMYHELELPGRPMCQGEPGYVRYVTTESAFRNQMQWLKETGWQGMNVSQGFESRANQGIVITFDDGCETDLITAAPLLRELGYNATFFITVDFLGKPGFLSQAQVRELCGLGFEIGCHSMTHAYLSELNPAELHREIADAKKVLEEMTGRSIEHFSCPGGRYNRRVVEVAKSAGYRTLSTSRASENSPQTDPFALGRVVVMRATGQAAFERLCSGQGLWKMRWHDGALSLAKHILGNTLYDRLRAQFLR